MMNFSDETVSKLVGAAQKARYMATCDIVSGKAAATSKEIDSRVVAAILSHLTLADLMQVKGVLELVDSARNLMPLHDAPHMFNGYFQVEKEARFEKTRKALTPFVEPKQ